MYGINIGGGFQGIVIGVVSIWDEGCQIFSVYGIIPIGGEVQGIIMWVVGMKGGVQGIVMYGINIGGVQGIVCGCILSCMV